MKTGQDQNTREKKIAMDDLSSSGSDRDGSPLLDRRRVPALGEPINPALGGNDSEPSAFLRLGDVGAGGERKNNGIAENEADSSWTQLEVPRKEHATTYVSWIIGNSIDYSIIYGITGPG